MCGSETLTGDPGLDFQISEFYRWLPLTPKVERFVIEMTTHSESRVWEILESAKSLASEFYKLTGKPLGVTGEVAEYEAARLLGLRLVAARMEGHDALRGEERIQIKGRAFDVKVKRSQRMGRIKLDANCDTVLLVLLDNASLDAHEIWEAPYADVCALLARPGSKSRDRGALGVSAFKAIARKVWHVGKPLEVLR